MDGGRGFSDVGGKCQYEWDGKCLVGFRFLAAGDADWRDEELGLEEAAPLQFPAFLLTRADLGQG